MDPVPSAGPAGSPSDETLQALAGRGRALVIESVAGAGAGHIGGPLSAMETATPVSRTMPRRVEAIGIDDEWGESAPNDRLLDRSGLTPERIAERVRDAIARAGTARA
jgi:transketolase